MSNTKAVSSPIIWFFYFWNLTNARWCPLSVRNGGYLSDLTVPSGFFFCAGAQERRNHGVRAWGLLLTLMDFIKTQTVIPFSFLTDGCTCMKFKDISKSRNSSLRPTKKGLIIWLFFPMLIF